MNVLKMFDLSGKVAVITGAGHGLGYQFAEAMAEAGANVVCADIDTIDNEKTAARVEALGRKVLAIKCDVTREADVANLFQSAAKAFGRVDITFANAGIADSAPRPCMTNTPRKTFRSTRSTRDSFALAWPMASATIPNLSPRSRPSHRWLAWPTPAKSRAPRYVSHSTLRVSRPD